MTAATPISLEEALSRARTLLTDGDKSVLRDRTAEEAALMLHQTLGHRLRNELGLWAEVAHPLYDDMTARISGCLVVDGDTASSALIDALWSEFHR